MEISLDLLEELVAIGQALKEFSEHTETLEMHVSDIPVHLYHEKLGEFHEIDSGRFVFKFKQGN